MREVLQDHRGADHDRCLLHDLPGPGAFQAQHREGLVDVAGAFHPFQLFGDDDPVHNFGDLDEPHPALHHDHGHSRGQCGRAQRFHTALPVADEFNNQAGTPPPSPGT